MRVSRRIRRLQTQLETEHKPTDEMSFVYMPITGLEIVEKPAHEIMALVVLRKLILQTSMRSHPVRLDV